MLLKTIQSLLTLPIAFVLLPTVTLMKAQE
jgi:hypothetical protein